MLACHTSNVIPVSLSASMLNQQLGQKSRLVRLQVRVLQSKNGGILCIAFVSFSSTAVSNLQVCKFSLTWPLLRRDSCLVLQKAMNLGVRLGLRLSHMKTPLKMAYP